MKNIEDVASFVSGCVRVAGFFLLLALLIPVALAYKRYDPGHPFRIPRLFHRLLLRVLGMHVRVRGTPSSEAPVLFISNHVSYLDIPVLGSLVAAGFVAKADVADWPLFGFLARVQSTVFIERRSIRAAEQAAQLREHFVKKQNLVLFPEGTSSEGLGVLPFKSSLFNIVEDSTDGLAITVQPVSQTCVELDELPLLHDDRALYAWYGDMTLVPHLWEVFKRGRFTVEVIFHAPLNLADYPNRKDIAAACQEIVARGIKQSLERPPVD